MLKEASKIGHGASKRQGALKLDRGPPKLDRGRAMVS